jgi:ATP-binding cassette subfamily F protein 3
MNLFVLLLSLAATSSAFSFLGQQPTKALVVNQRRLQPATALFAKKKKKTPAEAALEALEALEESTLQAPLSKKEENELLKKKQLTAEESHAEQTTGAESAKLSKKEAMLLKALELEKQGDEDQLSKKDLKALKKKEEKLQAKLDKKKDKKLQPPEDETTPDDEVPAVNGDTAVHVNGDANNDALEPQYITLEDKIRKDRPPPRIRVMESTQPGYTSLRLENVGITFRDQQVLKDVTWGVQTNDRIGLVGANGAGKTTQLRILANEVEPTTGDVVKSSKSLRVAMLRQEFVDELRADRTLKEELMSVFEEELQILEDIKNAETQLANTPPDDENEMQVLLDRMQELQNEAENKEIYALESRVQKVLDLMGFNEDEGEDLIASFSGGWKMRIGLGKVLLKDPNVLLLDEPTNHLDLESVEWLEAFLREQNVPMVIVSHDREFLDQVCTKIVDAEGGRCTEYDGNYSRFLQLKKARLDAWNAAYKAQEKKLTEEKQWINKFKVVQAQAAKQRQAKLDKFIKSDEYVEKPPFVGKPFRFRFPEAPRISPEVAEIHGLVHGYRNEQTQNRLFDEAELMIEKGDRIAVVGPNGTYGKTLLKRPLEALPSNALSCVMLQVLVRVPFYDC